MYVQETQVPKYAVKTTPANKKPTSLTKHKLSMMSAMQIPLLKTINKEAMYR